MHGSTKGKVKKERKKSGIVELQDGFYIRDLVQVSWSLIRDITLATEECGRKVL